MRFSKWGYTLPSREWEIFTVDFEKVLTRACKLVAIYLSVGGGKGGREGGGEGAWGWGGRYNMSVLFIRNQKPPNFATFPY